MCALVCGCETQPRTTPPPPAPSQSPVASQASGDQGPAGNQQAAASQGVDGRWFVDRTAKSGIEFSYSNGRSAGEFAIIESLGGGMGVFDFDLDGWVDVMFAGGGRLDDRRVTSRSCGLFRNLGKWQFQSVGSRAGVDADAFFTHGVYPGDFDGDGFDDLAVSGYGGVQLLKNLGDGTFETLDSLISSSENSWSSSLAWADFDGNGHLDLYVAHYVDWSWQNHPVCPGQGDVVREVCAPREFAALTDVIYFNDGDQNFRPESEAVGLVPGGKGLGVVAADVNLDGYVDIYVANDTTDNFLYINDGGGKFRETALLAGVAGDDAGVNTGSMGVCVFDATNDALPDIWVTNFERELSALYRNEGGGLFGYASRQAGFAAYEAGFVGFGTVAIDLDFDGDQDIVVANGHVSYASPHAPYRQRPLLFENQGGKRFQILDGIGYFAESHTGRGLAYGDFDNDGAYDLVFSHLEEPVRILQARSPSGRNWARIKLVGTESNRSGIGATINLSDSGERRVYLAGGGGSYLSQSDRRIVVTCSLEGQNQAVVVDWPSGKSELFTVSARQEATLIEGSGQPVL